MSTEESVQVVKDGFAAFGRGDIQGLLGLLSEDVEWHIPGEGLPLAGTYRGRDAVGQFFDAPLAYLMSALRSRYLHRRSLVRKAQ